MATAEFVEGFLRITGISETNLPLATKAASSAFNMVYRSKNRMSEAGGLYGLCVMLPEATRNGLAAIATPAVELTEDVFGGRLELTGPEGSWEEGWIAWAFSQAGYNGRRAKTNACRFIL